MQEKSMETGRPERKVLDEPGLAATRLAGVTPTITSSTSVPSIKLPGSSAAAKKAPEAEGTTEQDEAKSLGVPERRLYRLVMSCHVDQEERGE